MKKLLLIFSAFALIVVLSSFNFSSHEMVEMEEVSSFSEILIGPSYWTQYTSSRYTGDKGEWDKWNQTYLPPKDEIGALLKTLDKMEAIAFAD